MTHRSLRDSVIKIVERYLQKRETDSIVDDEINSINPKSGENGNVIEEIELIRNLQGRLTSVKSKSNVVQLNYLQNGVLDSVNSIGMAETIKYTLQRDVKGRVIKVIPTSDKGFLGSQNKIESPAFDK